jgi:hypothetical protein
MKQSHAGKQHKQYYLIKISIWEQDNVTSKFKTILHHTGKYIYIDIITFRCIYLFEYVQHVGLDMIKCSSPGKGGGCGSY